jgi:hypothetical protein
MNENQRLHDFLEQLKRLYVRCGKPTLSRFCAESAKLGHNPPLRKSTVHDVLRHKRSRWPEWPWIASFVETCREVASKNRLDLREEGELSEWYERFCEGNDARTEPDATTTRRYLDLYGRTGVRLLRHAVEGDADAAYQLGVLLLCDGYDTEAHDWLLRAVQGDHPYAPELFHHPDSHGPDGAPAAAYARGLEYENDGQPSIAKVFYERAERGGHIGAADRLRGF